MVIGIIADLHDNLVNFERFLEQAPAERLAELWIAGDVGTPETLEMVCERFLKPIRAAAGNVEQGHGIGQYQKLPERFSQLDWSSEVPMLLCANNISIALFHDSKLARQYARGELVRLVVSGHTHLPDLKQLGETWHVNPGALGGGLTYPTYVLANLDQFNIKLKRL